MDKLFDRLKKEPAIDKFVRAFDSKEPLELSGVIKGFLGQLLGILAEDSRPFFAVFPTDLEAKKFQEELESFNINCDYLPAREKVYYDIKVIDDKIMKDRLAVFKDIIDEGVKVVTLSLYTLYDYNLSLEFYKNRTLHFKKFDRYDFDDLVRLLISAGYKREAEVESRGDFSLRGGILDIFPVCEDDIVRIEFFDDEVDTIRLVDTESRLSKEYVEEKSVFPCEELILDGEIKNYIISQIESELSKVDEKEYYKKFKKIIEELSEDSYSGEREILFSYFPKDLKLRTFDLVKDFNILFIYNEFLKKELLSFYEYLDMEYEHLLSSYEVLDKNLYCDRLFDPTCVKEFRDRAFYISQLKQNIPGIESVELKVNPVPKYGREFDEIFKDISDYDNDGYKIYVTASDDVKKKTLETEFLDAGITFTYDDKDDFNIVFVKKNISSGFSLPNIKLILFGDLNVFGFAGKRTAKKKRKSSSKLRIQDINVGDFVIHEEHGVGQYNGVKTLTIKDVKKDYLEILYKDKDKLYVPVENINQIDKYTSKDGAKPKIYRLDSIQWKRAKEKTKNAVSQMARELIELYAKRSRKKGFSFSKDGDWQHQFEDSFKYVETDGQLIAIDQIKADMESDQPMDRLLLGDVGYGKTEVALRAAFKAIMDGKQVAMLTPTTLLAEQHTKTARERFKNFPVRIRNLSRFRSQKEIKATIKGVNDGSVDFVIGTHRLLSNDVKFKDLGLLIVDEEQRFGVKHKEKIKSMSENIDVLTLSATPIPRTLSMSLSGIRSMSVIDEPPLNRIPVQTYVLEYNDNIIRSAIIKEINRGGQVFFLYNDVKTMEFMKERLERLVPEARFFIANGQMPERQLEDVFYNFENHSADVLVTSTIIETGMDVPNVNTLIVYNSDRFGLSTLYQLRGRVGRSSRLAYAYFTYDKTNSLSEKAVKRLMAMKEFTDFGSGYKIAMRDLELRGAGNVLGLSQSGHMAEVGYELYMKYLNLAINEINGKPVQKEVNTKVDLAVESAIPNGFLEDTNLKMEIYRKISSLNTFDKMHALTDEIIDRFGDLPAELTNLMNIGLIKNIGSNHFVKSIIQNKNIIRVEYETEMLDIIDMNNFVNTFGDDAKIESGLPIIRLKVRNDPFKTVYKFFKSGFDVKEA